MTVSPPASPEARPHPDRPDNAGLRPGARPEVVDFLLNRRSRPAKTLAKDGPSEAEVGTILTAAARTPDHGKLEPWRFVVIRGPAQERVAACARARATALGMAPEAVDKTVANFTFGAVVIAVIASPRASDKIPDWEQHLSAGAACLACLNAALALGWGANWLTGPLARDGAFLAEALGCGEGEFVAGFVHVGAETVTPADRDRPDLGRVVTWL